MKDGNFSKLRWSAFWIWLLFIAICTYCVHQINGHSFSISEWTPIVFVIAILWMYKNHYASIKKNIINYTIEKDSLLDCDSLIDEIAQQERKYASDSILEINLDSIKPPKDTVVDTLKEKPVPLMIHRLTETIRAVRRGAPLENTDLSLWDELILAPPERELRAAMDTVLNLGIAGTFLSIILTMFFHSANSITSETLLDHIGPGLISGLVGVCTNICLRMLHSALMASQESLVKEVDTMTSDHFILTLGKKITCPEERMVTIIWKRLQKQTQSIILETTKDLIEPVKSISTSASNIALYSGTWAEIASDLKNALQSFIKKEEVANQKYEKYIYDILNAHETYLTNFLGKLDAEQVKLHSDSGKYLSQAVDLFAQAMKSTLDSLHEKLSALMNEQNTSNLYLLKKNIELYGSEVAKRSENIEEHVGDALNIFSKELPERINNSINYTLRDTLLEIVKIVDNLREDTSILASRIDQLSQSQVRISENLAAIADHQSNLFSNEDAILEEWLKKAQETIEQTRHSFEELSRSFTGIHDVTGSMLTPLQDMSVTIHAIMDQENQIHEAMHLSRLSINSQSDAMDDNAKYIRQLSENIQAAANEMHTFQEVITVGAHSVQSNSFEKEKNGISHTPYVSNADDGADVGA